MVLQRKKRVRQPLSEETKRKISLAQIGKERSKKWVLPEALIVYRLLNSQDTVRSLADEYGCSASTIKIIFRENTTIKQRLEAKSRKQGLKVSGENSPNWKGGITSPLETLRNSSKYKKWRLSVFARDEFKCVNCGKTRDQTILHAHHVKPFSLFPEYRFDVENGQTLCEPCHVIADTIRGRNLLYHSKTSNT